MKRLWQSHRKALIGFVLAATITLFFLVRLTVQAIYWSNPAHHDMPPQPWMTVRFVGRSWGIDPGLIDDKAGFPDPRAAGGHPLTLAEIARQRGQPVEQVIAELEAVLLALKAQEPPR